MKNKEVTNKKVFLRTFGCKMEASLQTNFTIFGRDV